MLALLATLIFLGGVIGVALGSGRGHGFRPGLAATRVHRGTGNNLASILAVLGLAGALIQGASLPLVGRILSTAPVLTAGAVVLLVVLAMNRPLGEVLLAVLGLGLLISTLGPSDALQLVVVSALMLWLFGAVRGFIG